MNFSASIGIPPHQTITSSTQQSSQCSLTNTGNQIGHLGLLLLLLTIGCLCLKQWHRKHCEQQSSLLRDQQIASLERIWRMQTHQDP